MNANEVRYLGRIVAYVLTAVAADLAIRFLWAGARVLGWVS